MSWNFNLSAMETILDIKRSPLGLKRIENFDVSKTV